MAYHATPPEIRLTNEFSFAPLKEVAWNFLGIFGTMIPVLDYMERHAGVKTPKLFGFVFKFALPVLIPIFVLVSFLFFR